MSASAALKSCREEVKRLKEELRMLEDAEPASEASKKIIEYMKEHPDPFTNGNSDWVTHAGGAGGCCITM